MSLFTTHLKHYERMGYSSEPCFVHQCQSLPHRTCNHCDRHFCHDHSYEHENRCSQTLSHLVDAIDKLVVRLSSVESYCLEQIEQWHQRAYQSIDRYGEKKRHELAKNKQETFKKRT